jgi:hypothetical protein
MEHLVAEHHGEEGAANQSRGYVGRRELREVGQPCEGRTGGGDDRPYTTRDRKPLEGRSATCPT